MAARCSGEIYHASCWWQWCNKPTPLLLKLPRELWHHICQLILFCNRIRDEAIATYMQCHLLHFAQRKRWLSNFNQNLRRIYMSNISFYWQRMRQKLVRNPTKCINIPVSIVWFWKNISKSQGVCNSSIIPCMAAISVHMFVHNMIPQLSCHVRFVWWD